jgi:hypothetical protein
MATSVVKNLFRNGDSRITMNGDDRNSSTSLIIGLTASSPQIECNQTAMGLPSVTSEVFLIAKSIW